MGDAACIEQRQQFQERRPHVGRHDVDGATLGAIGPGLLVLVCAERGDSEAQADKLLAKLLKLRIFGDAAGKMNRSVQDVGGTAASGRRSAGPRSGRVWWSTAPSPTWRGRWWTTCAHWLAFDGKQNSAIIQ